MNKTSKEYAQDKAIEYVEKLKTGSRTSFLNGYMTAVEENNVPELIEALELAQDKIRHLKSKLELEGFNFDDAGTRAILEFTDNALKKSKEI